MTDSPLDDLPGVIASFLDVYASDSKAGRSRPLSDYQALFPDFATVIANEWARLESGETEEKDPGDAFPAALRAFGSYRIVRELGRGGQGFVYLAHDDRLNRPVALKILTASAAESDASSQRLLREAESASRLDHPGICAVYGVGEEGGLPYIAMRYVEGETLAHRIAGERASGSANGRAASPTSASTRQARAASDGVAIIEKVARAIHAAHVAGIVHRDVKPGNIMITPTGEPVVLDFGMARSEHGAMSLTLTGQLVGTPAYMAPEQLQSGRCGIDRRTDVYALAVTLFECVTLRRPFEEATREQLYRKITLDAVPNPRSFNPAVSEDLRAILEVALEKEPNRRYQTAEAFADDLRRLQNLEPVRARRAGMLARSVRFSRRRPTLTALITILCISVPLIGVLIGFHVASLDDVETAAAVRRVEQVETLLVDGFTRLHGGDIEAAAKNFERAIEKDPTSQEAIGGLARTHLLADRPADALSLLETHSLGRDARAGLLLIRATVLKRLGRTAEATAIRARWDDAEKDSLGYFQAGEEALDAAHAGVETAPEAALEWMTRAVSSRGRARRLYHTQWAHAAGHAKDRRAAAHAADALVSLWPDSPAAWFWRGYALGNVGRLEEAERALTRCVERAPDFALAHRNLGFVRRIAGDLDGAVEAYRSALRIKPAQPLMHFSIARILSAKKDSAGAIEHLQRALALEPNGDAYKELGKELLALDRHEDAEAAFRSAIECGADGYQSRYRLALSLTARGAHAEALEHFLAACSQRPSDAPAHRGAGFALNRLGRWKDALKHLDIAQSCAKTTDNVKATILFERSVALARVGEPRRAIGVLRQLLKLRPNAANAHANLGTLLVGERALDSAREHFSAALRLDPNLHGAHSGLGAIHLRKSELDLAVECFRKAVALAPRRSGAQYDLGNCLRQLGKHQDALVHLAVAAKLDPRDPRPLFEQARVYANLKRFDEAIDCLRETLLLAPRFAEAHCNLGQYLKGRGREIEALGHLREGHLIGNSRGDDWRYPSQRWIEACERTVLARAIRDAQAGVSTTVAADRQSSLRRVHAALHALIGGWRAARRAGTESAQRLAAKLERVTSDPVLAPMLAPIAGETSVLSQEDRRAWRSLASSITALKAGLIAPASPPSR